MYLVPSDPLQTVVIVNRMCQPRTAPLCRPSASHDMHANNFAFGSVEGFFSEAVLAGVGS